MKEKHSCIWRMHIAVYAGRNKWCDCINFHAKSFEDACEKATKYAEEHSNDQQKMRFTGAGYEIKIGGGCRW